MNQMDYRQMVPSFDQMMIPVLQAIKKLGGKGSNDDIDKIAIQIMNLPDEVLKVPHNTTPYCSEVHYRLRWTRTYLKKYGIIHNIRRGFWAFTESFDGNIDSIDPAIIAKTVRNMNLETFHQSDLTKIESNVAFEKFIISGLKDYLESQNKGLVIAPLSDKNSFDAILPDGIDDLHKTIYVIISNNRSHIAHNTIQKLLGAKAYDWETECVLIIWGAILPEPIKSQFRADADQAGHIMVWDYNDFSNKIIQASNYMDYLITPKKTLVQDAIGDAPKAMSESEESIQKDRLEGLKKAYQNQDIVLILGAGVSMDAGIPLWSKLINDLLVYMVDKLQGSKLNKNQLRQLSELALKNQQGSPITEMRYIKAALESDTENADNVNEIIHHVLYPQKVHSDTELIHSIINLSTPKRNHIGVKQIITYNFDDLIENQLESHNIDFNVIYKDTDLSNGQSLNIYHVHGFLPQRMEPTELEDCHLIFSEEDYHQVYRDAYCWSNIIQLNSFRDSTCLFIGCSITDPNLRRLLDVAARTGETPRHYAIMKRKDIKRNKRSHDNMVKLYSRFDKNIQDSFFQSLGINIIWVDSYTEIPKILGDLIK